MKKLKGSELKVGMHVVCLKAPESSILKSNTGGVLTIKAINLPYLVVEAVRRFNRPSSGMSGVASVLLGVAEESLSRTTTLNSKKHRFMEVTQAYLDAVQGPETEKKEEFASTIGES